jgi:uncharacterized protein
VREQLQLLWKLQTVEQQIDEAQQEQDSYPLALEELQGMLKAQEAKREDEERKIEECEKERLKKEGELDLENERIKRSQLKLLEIKTNKEYQALLQEIEGSKERNGQREEEIIKLLDDIDQLKSNYTDTVEKTQKERLAIEEEILKLKEKMAKVEQDLLHLHQSKEEIVPVLDASLLKRYNTLKEKNNGTAIVLVKNEGCQGCFVNIPPQMYNEVQKNREIILCPNCHRILYWENKPTD